VSFRFPIFVYSGESAHRGFELNMRTIFVLLISAAAGPVFAEESRKPEVMVVSASRTEMDLAKVASSISVIDRQEIENRQVMFVGDLIRDLPGVAVTRSGSKGNLTEVRIRGGEANQVLVMIDGIRANDPASGDQFQWQYLTTNDIEKIEVIRGPQSALWGADANAGVINITTTKAEESLEGGGFLEAGSYESVAGGLRIGGAGEEFSWGVNASVVEQDGFNVAQQGDEDDPFSNRTGAVNLGFRPAENARVDFVARYTDAETSYDAADAVCDEFFNCTGTGFIVDADEKSEVSQGYAGLSGSIGFLDKRWTHQLFAGWTETENDFYTDGANSFSSEGSLGELKYQTNWDFAQDGRADGKDVVTFAVDYQDRSTKTSFGVDDDTHMTGLVLEGRSEITEAFSLTGSLRHDLNSDYQDVTTWRLTSAYDFLSTATRLRAAAGTGQKAPTASELYGFGGDFIGNPDLKPEQSNGWEVGIDQDFVDGAYRLSLTYFDEQLEDQITGINAEDPDNPGNQLPSMTNAPGTTKRKGVEFSAFADIVEGLSARLAYTYLDSDAVILQRDFINNEINIVGRGREVRRPRNSVSLGFNYLLLQEKLNTNLNATWTDKQEDAYFPPPFFSSTRVGLDSYTLVDFTTEYKFTQGVSLYGRVKNIFDEEYEEVFTYNTPGRTFHAGVRVTL
jgi:vitamin B12 transporter